MRRASRIAMAVLLAAGLMACGETTDTDDTSTPVDETVSPVAADAEVLEALDDVIAACSDRDRDRLRDTLDPDLGDQVRDRDRDRLFADDDVTFDLVSRTVEVDGDTATVTAVFDVTDDGETTQVERVWVFERTDDGTWVLTDVPDCLFAD